MQLVDVDARVTAAVLVVLMLIASELGIRMGLRAAKRNPQVSTRIDDAVSAVFALIVGFSFAGSAAKHDRRVWLMVDEATAIGDFATVASVLGEPDRSKLTGTIRDYVDLRLTTAHTYDSATLSGLIANTRRFESEMQQTVAHVVREQNTPSVHTALVMNLNATTTALEKRIAALYDHIPSTILCMLLVSAVLTLFSLGRVQGLSGTRQPFPTFVFIALVAIIVYVTLDLEQPRSGLVRIPTHALQSVRSTLGP